MKLDACILTLLMALLISSGVACHKPAAPADEIKPVKIPTMYAVTGVIKELKLTEHQVVIKHDAITNYMPAMTMAFTIRDSNQWQKLNAGDRLAFQLFVMDEESWIEPSKILQCAPPATPPSPLETNAVATLNNSHPLLDYKFTNELGQPVSFNDLRGKAVAFTFFFTRCPLPEYCPRLMKNFVGASDKLRALPDAPTNWHFLAITIDPTFDTPEVLKACGQHYQYDSNHWSFLTGESNRIAELAQAAGMHYEPDGAGFNHNFRTLVLNPAGQLQMNFPIGGDLSDLLVAEIVKAAAITNR